MTTESLPWPAINDFVLKVGERDTAEGVFQAAFEEIGALVPYDFAHLVMLGEAAPDAFGRKYGIRRLQSKEIPSPYQERYPYFFANTDLRSTIIRDRPALFLAKDTQFTGTEFGEDWCRPLKARWSAGIRVIDRRNELQTLLILYRENCSLPFQPRDLDILEALQPHIRNLAERVPRISVNLGDRIRDLGQLSPREREIARLICSGQRTKAIASTLRIGETTAYRHIHHIFGKLGIQSRQELVARAMQLPS